MKMWCILMLALMFAAASGCGGQAGGPAVPDPQSEAVPPLPSAAEKPSASDETHGNAGAAEDVPPQSVAVGDGAPLLDHSTLPGSLLPIADDGESAEPSTGDPLFHGQPLSYWTAQAERSLPEAEDAQIVNALVQALGHQDLAVQVAACDALETMGPRAVAAAPALIAVIGHERPWVNVAIMDALAALGRGATPALTEAVQTGDPRTQFLCGLVLGSMGPEAAEALPTLEALGETAASPLKERLPGILKAIRGDTPVPRLRETAQIDAATLTIETIEEPADWPQFRGPQSDGICRESGLLPVWPEGGPELLWQLEGLGKGFSSVSIVGGRLYTMGDRPAAADLEDRRQYVLCYDLATREQLWAMPIGPPHGSNQPGPRCTPTVQEDGVYVLGTEGDLVCLDAATGAVRWQKNLVEDFGGRMMSGWKYSESPVIDGDRVLVTPGGKDAAIVALNKQTGETVWQSALPDLGSRGNDGAGYATMIVAEIAGRRQCVQILGRGAVGVDAETGAFLWGYNAIANDVANIPSPVVQGDYVFVTTSYRTGSALLKIVAEGEGFKAEELYFLTPNEFENHHGGVVLVNGYIYGGDGQNRGRPVCLDFATGQIRWKQEEPPDRGSAAVLYADGRLIFRYDRGTVALVAATPAEFRLISRFTPITADGPAWAHPVIHGGRLYLRHDDLLLCYDVKAP